MFATTLSLFLALFAARDGEAAAPGGADAADYLARTTWVCLMPPDDAYEAHRCGPTALAQTCTAAWLAMCERHGGAPRPCGTDGCPDVYVGKRADRPRWERRRIAALRAAAKAPASR